MRGTRRAGTGSECGRPNGLDAGITAFQYRDKGNSQLTTAERFALGQQLRERCAQAHVPFIVDDDVELALALQEDGIHVGQRTTG